MYTHEHAKTIKALKATADHFRDNVKCVTDSVAKWIVPKGDFYSSVPNSGTRDVDLFNDTAVRANDTFSSAIVGGYTNASSEWFSFTPVKNKTEQYEAFASYVAKDILSHLADPSTGFYTNNKSCITSWSSFGTFCMAVKDGGKGNAVFKQVPFHKFSFLEDAAGKPNIVFREYCIPLYKAIGLFGRENLPERVLKMKPTDEVKFFEAVMDRDTYEDMFNEPAPWPEGKSFGGCVYLEGSKCEVVKKNAYTAQPYIVCRYDVNEGEVYGTSPAWNCLCTIRLANVFSKLLAQQCQHIMAPILLSSDDASIIRPELKPFGIIAGGIGPNGEKLVSPLQITTDLNAVLLALKHHEDKILRAFYVDMFEDRQGTPVSAAEYTSRSADKLRLTGAKTTRLESEYLGPLIESVFSIRRQAGVYNDELAKLPSMERDTALKIKYLSPLAKNQEAEELYSVQRFIQAVGPVVQMNPESAADVAGRIDNGKFIRWAASTSGLPYSVLKDEEQYNNEIAAKKEQMQSQQNDAMMMEGAKALGSSGLDVNKLAGL